MRPSGSTAGTMMCPAHVFKMLLESLKVNNRMMSFSSLVLFTRFLRRLSRFVKGIIWRGTIIKRISVLVWQGVKVCFDTSRQPKERKRLSFYYTFTPENLILPQKKIYDYILLSGSVSNAKRHVSTVAASLKARKDVLFCVEIKITALSLLLRSIAWWWKPFNWNIADLQTWAHSSLKHKCESSFGYYRFVIRY